MATEADIPESISITQIEAENKYLTSKQHDRIVNEFSQGELEKFQGGNNQPPETSEFSAQTENMQVSSDLGVETIRKITTSNVGTSEGESFYESPSAAKLAHEETCKISKHCQADDIPFQADKKLSEDEKQMQNDGKFDISEETASGENEVMEGTEERAEKSGMSHDILNLTGTSVQMATIEEPNFKIEEEKSLEEERILEVTSGQNKEASIHGPDLTINSMNKDGEIVMEAFKKEEGIIDTKFIEEEKEETSAKEVDVKESEKSPDLVDEETGPEAIKPGERAEIEKDVKEKLLYDSTEDVSTPTVAASPNIQTDEEAIIDIGEGAKEELYKPSVTMATEVSSMIEAGPGFGKELKEASDTACVEKSEDTIESSEQMENMPPVEDEMHDTKLETSLVTETEKICLQAVDNPEIFKEVPEVRSEDIVKESQEQVNDQTQIHEKIAQTDSAAGEKCKDYENPEEKVDTSLIKYEGMQSVSEGLDTTDASAKESTNEGGSTVVVGNDKINDTEMIAEVENCQREMSKHEGSLEGSLLQQNEPENAKLERSLSIVSEDIHTAASSAYAETNTCVTEETPIKIHEEGSKEKGMEDTLIQNDDAGENGIPKEENLPPTELNEKIGSVEVEITKTNPIDFHVTPEEAEQKECEKLNKVSKFEPEEVHEANGASKGEEKNVEDNPEACQSTNSAILEHTSTEEAVTTELTSKTNEMDTEKFQKICELDSEENLESKDAEEKIEEAIQKEKDCDTGTSQITKKGDDTVKTISDAETSVMVKSNVFARDETIEKNSEVESTLEAAPAVSCEDESNKAEDNEERSDITTDKVQDGPEITGTVEATNERIIDDNITCLSPELIEKETVQSSKDNEDKAEKSKGEDSGEQIIEESNVKDLSSEVIGEGPVKNFQDDENEAKKSEGEIFEGFGTAETGESIGHETSQTVESPKDMLDTSMVIQEESRNLAPAEASPEEKINEDRSSVVVDEENSTDTKIVDIKGDFEEGGDDSKQILQKSETGEMFDTSLMKQEEGLQSEDKNLTPAEASPEEKRNEDRPSVMMTEETGRDAELVETTGNIEKSEEDSKQTLQKNEAGEMLDTSSVKQEEILQDEGKNINLTEASPEEKRNENSVIGVEENGSDTEAVTPNADMMKEGDVQKLDETLDKEEKDKETKDNLNAKDIEVVVETSDASESTESIVLEPKSTMGKMESETSNKGYELDSTENLEGKDAMKNTEEEIKKETKEEYEGSEIASKVEETETHIIKEEDGVSDITPQIIGEETVKSSEGDENEKQMTKVEVYEELQTTSVGEDAEKEILEEKKTIEENLKSIEKEFSDSQKNEKEMTGTGETADFESGKEILNILEATSGQNKEASIHGPDLTVMEACKKEESIIDTKFIKEEKEETSVKEVEVKKSENSPDLVDEETGPEAVKPGETAGIEKDVEEKTLNDSIEDVSTSTVAASPNIQNDEEAIIDIGEGAKEELYKPSVTMATEVSSMIEAGPEFGKEIKEASDIACIKKSQDTVESSEKMEKIAPVEDEMHETNKLDTSLATETEKVCLQAVENPEIFKEVQVPEIRSEDTVEDILEEVKDQTLVSSMIEAGPEFGKELKEASDIACIESQDTIESSEKMENIPLVEDEMHDTNKLDTSLVTETEKICLQKVDNLEIFKEVPEGKSEDIVKESLEEVKDQTEIHEKIAQTDSAASEKCKDYKNPEEKDDASFVKDEGMQGVGEGLDTTDASARESTNEGGYTSNDNINDTEMIAAVENSQREMSKHEGSLEESLLQQNEPENGKLERSLTVVSEDIHTAASSAYAESITCVTEETPIKSHEEGFEEKGMEDTQIQNDDAGENGIPKEENLPPTELNEKIGSVEAEITNTNPIDFHVTHPLAEEAEQKECEELNKGYKFEPEQVHEANGASKGEEKHVEDNPEACQSTGSAILEHTSTEREVTTELASKTNEMNTEKFQKICELDSEENLKSKDAEEKIEEAIQKEQDCDAETCQIKTKSDDTIETISDAESSVMVKSNVLARDETIEQNSEVESTLEAAPAVSCEDESNKAEDNEGRSDITTDKVQDGPKITGTGEATNEQIIEGNIACLSPELIEKETFQSSKDNEDKAEKSEGEDSEELIEESNVKDLSPEVIAQGLVKNFQDDENEAKKSEGEIFEGFETAETGKSIAHETSQTVESPEDMLDTSMVIQEESRNLAPAEASPEEKINEDRSSVLVDEENSNDTKIVEVKGDFEEGGDDSKQISQKIETGEMFDTSLLKQEEGLQSEDKNLTPAEASPEEKRNEDRPSVMMTEETGRDAELVETAGNIEKYEEDSKQTLQKNEAGEMLDTSLVKQEEILQDEGKNINLTEASPEEKRNEDSVIGVEVNGSDTEAGTPNADKMEEGAVQKLDETLDKEEKDKETKDNLNAKDIEIIVETSDASESTKSIVLEPESTMGKMESETSNKGYELDSTENLEGKDAMKNTEEEIKKETKEEYEGSEIASKVEETETHIIKEEDGVSDIIPQIIGEETVKSSEGDENEKQMTKIEVYEETQTKSVGEDAEKQILEKNTTEENLKSIEKEFSDSQKNEKEMTEIGETADFGNEVLNILEATSGQNKEASIHGPDLTVLEPCKKEEGIIDTKFIEEEREETSVKEVEVKELEKSPDLVDEETGPDAVKPGETAGIEKDAKEKIIDIGEGAKEELYNPSVTMATEVSSIIEAGPEFSKELTEASSIACIEKSEDTIESSEKMENIPPVEDEMHDTNKLDTSLVTETEKICLQEVDNPEIFKEFPELRSEDIVKESPEEVKDQTEIHEKIAQTDSAASEKCKDYENPEEKVDASLMKDEGTQSVGEGLDTTDASVRENTNGGESTVVVGNDNISDTEIIAAVEQCQKEMSKHEGSPEESLLQQNEAGNEILERSLSMGSEEIHPTASSAYAETITCVSEETPIKSHEEAFQEKGKEDTPIQNDAAGEKGILREKNLPPVVISDAEALVKIKSNEFAGDETVKQRFEVESILEAAPAVSGEDDSNKAEDNEERNNITTEEVQDAPKITSTGDATNEQIIKDNVTCLSRELIEEETVQSSQDNENKAEKCEGEDSIEQIIEKSNIEDLSPEVVGEGPVKNFQDDGKEAEESKGEIFEGSETPGASESVANETSQTVESPKDMPDTSMVKQEESLHSESKNLTPTEASPEQISSVIASERSSSDTELVKVKEIEEKGEDDIKQILQKNETGEMLDTSLVKREEGIQSEGKNLCPTEASLEEKINEDSSSVVMTEETGRDAELVETAGNVEKCEEDSKQILQKNEAGEMLDTSLVKQEEILQNEGKNLNLTEAEPEEKRNEDSVIGAEENSSDAEPVEAKGNVEKSEEDWKQILQENEAGEELERSLDVMSEETGAVTPDADDMNEGAVQNFEETLEKEEKDKGIKDNNGTQDNVIAKVEDIEIVVEASNAMESVDSIVSEPEPTMGKMESETSKEGYKLDSTENLEGKDSMENIEEEIKKETKQEYKGSEIASKGEKTETHIVKEECGVSDITPEIIGEETVKSIEGDEDKKQMPKVEGCERIQTDDIGKLNIEEGSTAEDKENLGDKPEEEVQDGTKITVTREATNEQIIKGNITRLSPELIEDETVRSSQDNENKAEKCEGEDISEQIIEKSNIEDLSPEVVGEGPVKNFQDDGKDTEKSKGEIFEGSETTEASESIANETSQTVESPKDMLDTSMVKQEESLHSESKNLTPTEASPEEISSVIVSEQNSSDTELGKVKENVEEGEDDLEQILQKNEKEEMLETSLVEREEGFQTESKNLCPTEASPEEKINVDSSSVVITEEIGQDAELVETAGYVEKCEERSEQILLKNEAGEMLDTSLLKQEEIFQNEGQNLNLTEAAPEEKRNEDSVIGTEENSSDTEPIEAKGNVEKGEEDSKQMLQENETEEELERSLYVMSEETEAVTPNADDMEEGVVQKLEETLEKEEKGIKDNSGTKDIAMVEDMESQRTESIVLEPESTMGKMESETSNKGYELDSTENLEHKDAMKNIDEEIKKETKEEYEGSEIAGKGEETETHIIKEEYSVSDITPEITGEETVKSSEGDENEKQMTKVEVYEELQTTSVGEDDEKQILEEKNTIEDQFTVLDGVENIEHSSKEDNKVAKMPKQEACDIIETEDIGKQNIEEGSIAEDKENLGDEPEKEVCKEFETAALSTSSEKENIEEHTKPGLPLEEETVKESSKEDESDAMQLKEEVHDSNSALIEKTEATGSAEETTSDTLHIIKAREEDGDLVDNSSVSEMSEKDIKEEISAKREITVNDSDTVSVMVETEGTSYKEAELEDKMQVESSNLASQEMDLAVTETKGATLDNVDISAKPENSSNLGERRDEMVPTATDEAGERMEYEKQDKVPDAGSEGQKEETTGETRSEDILGDDLKENPTMPSQEHQVMTTKASETTDETPARFQAPCENVEAPVITQATDEMLMQKVDKPTDSIDDSELRSVDTRKENEDEEVQKHRGEDLYVDPELNIDQDISKSEDVVNLKREETGEAALQRDICKSKSLKDEESSSLELEKEKTEDEKPLDEASKCIETSVTCTDGEKDIQEQENFPRSVVDSSKEGVEVEKAAVEFEGGAHSHEHEVTNSKDDETPTEENLVTADLDERLKCASELVAEDQSNETLQESNKSKIEGNSNDIQDQEGEKEIKVEKEPKLEPEDRSDKEQNTNETMKAVILSEEVHEGVEKADNDEIVKEQVIEEESGVNELHTVITKDETTNEVKDSSPLSTEYLKATDCKREATFQKESEEEKAKEGGSEKPVDVSITPAEESDEKVEKITEEAQSCYTKIDTATGTAVTAETSFREAQLDDKLVKTLDISSDETSLETTETEASQQGNRVDSMKLEETSCDLASQIPANDGEHTEKESGTLENPDVVEDEEIKIACAAVYESKEHETKETDETGKGPTVKKLDADEIEEETEEASNMPDYKSRGVEAVIEDEITADQTLPAEKPDEQLQTLSPFEEQKHVNTTTVDREEEDKTKEAEKLEDESPEDFSAAKTTKETCLQMEGPRELEIPKLGLELNDEDIKHSPNEVHEEERGTLDEVKEDTEKVSETVSKSESQSIEAVIEDETTADQTVLVEAPSSKLLLKEQEYGTVTTMEKTEEKTKEVEMLQDETPENSSAPKTTEETCPQTEEPKEKVGVELNKDMQKECPIEVQKEEGGTLDEIKEASDTVWQSKSQGVEAVKITTDQTLPLEISEKQHQTPSSALLCKEQEHETTRTIENIEEKTKEVEMLQDESPEDSSATKTTKETCLPMVESRELELDKDIQKDSPNEVHEEERGTLDEVKEDTETDSETVSKSESQGIEAVTVDETTADQTVLPENSSAPKTMEETCPQTEEPRELELSQLGLELSKDMQKECPNEVQKEEGGTLDEIKEEIKEASVTVGQSKFEGVGAAKIIADQTLPLEISEEQHQTTSSELLCKEQEHGTTRTIENIEDKTKEVEMLQDESPAKSSATKTTEELCSQMEESRELEVSHLGLELNKDIQNDTPNVVPEEEGGILNDIKGEITETSETASNEVLTKSEDTEIMVKHPEEVITDLKAEDNQFEKIIEATEIIQNEGLIEQIKEEKEDDKNCQPVSPGEETFKESHQEFKLKAEENLGEKTNETFKTKTFRNEELYEEIEKAGTSENIVKQISAEEKVVVENETIKEELGKDVKEAESIVDLQNQHEETNFGNGTTKTTTLSEEESCVEISQNEGTMDPAAALEVTRDIQQQEKTSHAEAEPKASIEAMSAGRKDVPTVETKAGDSEPEYVTVVDSRVKEYEHDGEKRMDDSGEIKTEESTSMDSAKISLCDLMQRSTKETPQVAGHLTEEKEPMASKEEMHVKDRGIVLEKDEEEEGDEHKKTDSSPDALVMVEASKDTDVKVAHKKSHNILSGVGSKVKHSFSKVKKAITGKSSHPKSVSPK